MYKKIKNYAAMMLAVSMLFGSVSCGKKAKSESKPEKQEEKTVTEAAEPTKDSREDEPGTDEKETPDPTEDRLVLEGLSIAGDEEFGGVFFGCVIEDFNAMGFEFGDSINIEFSNGYKFEDLPYYNGYYVDAGNDLLVGYPGYGYIKLAENYGNDLFVVAGLDEKDTATISINEKGKYLGIQQAMDIHYQDERDQYPSDEIFANFRAVKVGNLKENVLYRGASPIDNQHNRAAYSDALSAAAGIEYDVDLSDNETKLELHLADQDFNSPHFRTLYDSGKVCVLGMSMNYFSDTFIEKLHTGLAAMAENKGPYLVHCVEGKDRTGLFCMLLEAFAGASYQEIVDDYMLTYENYYNFNKESDPEKYEIIKVRNLDRMIKFMCGDDDSVDIATADLKAYAKSFMKKIGMTDAEIEALRNNLVEG